MKFVPLSERRHDMFSDLTLTERTSLQELVDKRFLSITSITLPEDGPTLYPSFKEENINGSKVVAALVDGVKASKKGSIERRALGGLLCGTNRFEDVQTFLKGHEVTEDMEMEIGMEPEHVEDRTVSRVVTGEAPNVGQTERVVPAIMEKIQTHFDVMWKGV